jgi:hypothetical protein
VVEATERACDWGAPCAAGRAAHHKVLDAGDWLLGHPRQYSVRVAELGTAVDELQEHGVELFHPWLAWYAVAALTRDDGDLVARVVRVQKRDREVTRRIVRDLGRGVSHPLMRSRVEREVGEIVLGDGDEDAAVIAERLETVRQEVGMLSKLVRDRYQQAVAALDDQLLADAAARDDARRQRLLNAPLVDALNGQRPRSPRRPQRVSLDGDGVRLGHPRRPRA